MFIAIDADENKINVENAVKGIQYFCPICREKVEFHSGSIRQHHFKHWKNSECLDNWHHDMTEWHLAWQNQFSTEQQEVIIKTEDEIHRADVLVGKTVVEFQHSKMSPEEFKERNSFYSKLGYKLVWLFDLRDEVKADKIEKMDEEGQYGWKWSFSTFSRFDTSNKDITVFFQFYDAENNDTPCIKKMTKRNTSSDLTKVFWTNHPQFYTPDNFLQLIKNEYLERSDSNQMVIDERLNHIEMPELAKYGFHCDISLEEEKPDLHIIETRIVNGFSNHGGPLYTPRNIKVNSLYSYGIYSEISIDLWTYNDCRMSCYDTVQSIIGIIKSSVDNVVEIKNSILLGRKIREIFEKKPSSGKGLIDVVTGTDVYVKKEHIYKKAVYGRLITPYGNYQGSNREIFYADYPRWVEKFSSK